MACKHSLLILSLALASLVLDAQTANACSCGRMPTVVEEYELANVVVIAQVMSVEKSTESERSVDGVRSTRMIVEKIFKGALKLGDEMIFAQGGGADCIWTFTEKSIGQRFLFYLSSKGKEQILWYAVTCGRSNNVNFAADDLGYLANMTKVRGKTRLSGTLSFYQASSVEAQEPIHITLDGRRVIIIGEKKTYELITNQDGVYEIYDLPAGKYTVEPEVPDGWKIDHPYQSMKGEAKDKDTVFLQPFDPRPSKFERNITSLTSS